MTSSPHFFSGIVEERNVSTRENHLTREWRDEVVSEKNFSLTATSRISHVGWFSRMVVFCLLYCPWGKMGTTRSLGSNHFLPLDKKMEGLQLKKQRRCLLPWISAGNKCIVIQCCVHHIHLCAKKLMWIDYTAWRIEFGLLLVYL